METNRLNNVDIAEELAQFSWHKPRWTSNKLIAASPFRYDHTPSFFVNLNGEYAGTWSDSGAYDAEWASGNFPKLLAFLRNETVEETVEYLETVYGNGIEEGAPLPTFRSQPIKRRATIDDKVLLKYRFRSPYLGKRAISEPVQRFADVGFDRDSQAVTLPWRHVDGKLASIKFRKIHGKTFWYIKGGAPIRSLVYNIDKAYARNWREVVVCEAEIDALSWMTAGKPAIAIGGVSVSRTQLDLIKRSPIERLTIAPDNDNAGDRLVDQLTEGLHGFVTLEIARVPAPYKDANEALSGGVELANLPVGEILQNYIRGKG